MRHVGVVLSAAAAILVLAAPAVAAGTAPDWIEPTPAEATQVSVTGGTTLEVVVAASDIDAGDEVRIEAASLPRYATLVATPGNPATATLTVAPPAGAHGLVAVTLVARDAEGNATARTLVFNVVPDAEPFSLI